MNRCFGLVIAMVVFMGLTLPMAHGQENAPQDDTTPYMLVIDTSGSMGDRTDVARVADQAQSKTFNRTRLDLAKSSLQVVLTSMDQTNPLGVFTYPGGTSDAEGCYPGEVIASPAVGGNRGELSNRIRDLSAGGDTPIGPALRKAAETLQDKHGGPGVIVLFSDGEANCGNTPVCEVAQELKAEGHQVTVNTVGLNLNESAKQELSCVADVTGGRAMFSDDESELQEMITDSILPTLEVDAQVPGKIASGTSLDHPGAAAKVTVGVRGNSTARNVRAVLTIYGPNGAPGAVTVIRPVQYFGNLTSSDRLSRTFLIRPDGSQAVPPGTYTWEMAVASDNTKPIEITGKLVIDDSLSRADLGPVFDGVEHVVILGDSYASGEGAASADEPYFADHERCHRTNNNYGTVLFGKDATTTLACSGAVAADFTNESTETHWFFWQRFPVDSQMKQLNEVMDERRVDAVLMSIGGNDIGFADLIATCVTSSSCGLAHFDAEEPIGFGSKWAEDEMRDYGAGAQGVVHGAIRTVDYQLNGWDGTSGGEAGDAPIIVIPYPRIIPQIGAFDPLMKEGACFAGVNGRELELLNILIDSLNGAVEAAVNSLRKQGRPVYYADRVVHALQPNHTMCDPDPWVVEDRSPWLVTKNAGAGALTMFSDDGKRNMQQLVHPNQNGHAAMARAIAAWSLTEGATPPVFTGNEGTGVQIPALRSVPGPLMGKVMDVVMNVPRAVNFVADGYNTVRGYVSGTADAVGEASRDVIVAGAEIVGKVNWVEITVDALTTTSAPLVSPMVQYRLSINSEPMVLGYGVADSLDDIPENIHLPGSVPPGDHTLVLHVFDPEGQIRVYEADVTVISTGTYLAILALLLGGILLLISLSGLGLMRLVGRRNTSAEV